MTYLFVGGEDSDFTAINNPGGVVVDTGNVPYHYRPQFARYGMIVGVPGAKNSSQLLAQNVFSQSLFWFTARVWCGNNGGWGSNDILLFFDTNNLPRIALRNPGTFANGPFQICTVNTAGNYVQLGSNFITSFQSGPSGPEKLDVFINYATSGTITVYINNNQVYTYAGDVTTNSVAALTGFGLGCFSSGFGSANLWTVWSEVIVSTNDTRNLSLATLYPIGAGNTANWSGPVATMAAIPSQPQNPMTTGTATAVQEFVATTPTVGSYLVDAVVVSALANCGTTGPQHAQLMLRTGATDYNSGTLNLGNNYTYITNIWPTNPNTSLPWTMADITTSVCKWNTTIPSGTTQFSADGLQVTMAWSSSPLQVVPATQPHTLGQWYFEITINNVGNSTCGLGVCNYNAILGNPIGNDNNSIRYMPNGTIAINNTLITTIATYTAGNVIGVAVDLTNKMIWFRVGAGNWNNNVANNPTTNTGGISITSISAGFNSAVMPCVGTTSSGTYVWTANFGASSFGTAAPSGFSAWNNTTVSNALNIGIEAIA